MTKDWLKFNIVSCMVTKVSVTERERGIAPTLCPIGTSSLPPQTNTFFTAASSEDQSFYLDLFSELHK